MYAFRIFIELVDIIKASLAIFLRSSSLDQEKLSAFRMKML